MSNFLKNLARRSAGLPLAAECRPTPALVFESRFTAGEALNDVTSEQVAASNVEAAAAPQFQNLNAAAAAQVQRSIAEQPGAIATARPAIRPSASSVKNALLQPSSSLAVVSSERAAPPVRGDANAQPASFEIVSSDSELISPAEPARAQATLSPRRDLPSALNPPATTLRRGDPNESTWPEISIADATESAQQNVEPAETEHLIRPAPTTPPLSLQFPRNATASPQPQAPLPIHVHIGRVEVRGTPTVQPSAPATPAPSPPLGFAGYHRMRRYRT